MQPRNADSIPLADPLDVGSERGDMAHSLVTRNEGSLRNSRTTAAFILDIATSSNKELGDYSARAPTESFIRVLAATRSKVVAGLLRQSHEIIVDDAVHPIPCAVDHGAGL
jgi:hypothetical protein